jgi:ferric-dicitrate binding protein FerR (iron transport regulator)
LRIDKVAVTPLDALQNRFLDDQSDLSPDEFDELIAGLKADPARAASLRQQLVVDDLLAQKLTVDRRNFLAQVEQRISDHQRNEQEIDSQVVELHAMAAAEIERPVGRPNRVWVQAVLAASILAMAVGAWLLPKYLPRPDIAVAKVKELSGEVTSMRDSRSEPLTASATLFAGQVITTPTSGMLELEYADQSVVRIAGDSRLTVESDPTSGAKRLRLDRGQVWADVAKQTVGAMQIVTPHAVATVLGTQFRLTVGDTQTLLEVTRGKVQLESLAPGQPILVAANESGLATADGGLDFREVKWPENSESVAFAIDPFTRVGGVFRGAETGDLYYAEFAAQGGAALNDFTGAMEFSGGWFVEADGGRDVAAHVRGAGEFTLEIVLLPAATQPASEATVVVLAAEDGTPNFELDHAKDELVFTLRTDQGDAPAELRLPMVAGKTPAHVTIAFADGELVVYRDGAEIDRKKVAGSLATWTPGTLAIGADAAGKSPWHGSIEAMAIFARRLDAGEMAQNVQNFRTLAKRP